MDLETIPITSIIPAEYNPRKISDTEYEKLANSINEFGFVDPIIINLNNNHIIGGHQRYTVLLDQYIQKGENSELNLIRLGDIGWIFPETELTIHDEDYEKALNIALNQISGEWDLDKLEEIFTELTINGFDTELTGFNSLDLEDLDIHLETIETPTETEITEDEYEPEEDLEVTVEHGDYYRLGNHYLLCGDSTKQKDIKRLVDGATIDMIFTDPPYGMSAVSKSGVLSERYKTDILNDDTNDVAIKSFQLAREMYPDITHIWWGANYFTEALPSAEGWLVWDKNNGASDQTDCELAYSNIRSVVRKFTTASEKKGRVHPTQKPIRLYEAIFNKFQNKGTFNRILDLFGGGGSTLIYCEQSGRQCYMMELDPYYCQIILNRYEEYTGNKAVKIGGDDNN
ncbi:DNA methyltransferase [Methanobrevibacter sp.]|uniref:DNA methyltransferase n=1 Tax=Methanobrevibacter sp. TaxID=66852 RepID=UPI003865CA4D